MIINRISSIRKFPISFSKFLSLRSQTQVSIVLQIASVYLHLFLQLMYRFLGPGMNFLCWDSPFLFSEFSSSWDRYSAEDSEFCFVSLWPDGILILFFDIFGNGGQGNFEKGISCFDKSPFGFSFLFYEQLNKERYTSVWFNSFSGRVLWIFRIVSVRIVAALLLMLIGSAFSEDIRSRT